MESIIYWHVCVRNYLFLNKEGNKILEKIKEREKRKARRAQETVRNIDVDQCWGWI